MAVSLLLAVGYQEPVSAVSGQDPGVLVTFTRTSGWSDPVKMTINRDGAARIEETRSRERRNFRVEADELCILERELEEADFPGLESSYPNDYYDDARYSVTYEGRTVESERDAAPPALERVIRHLVRILQESSK